MAVMNSALLMLLLACVGAVISAGWSSAQTVGEWTTGLPDLPGAARHHPITFTLGDIGFVMMGTTRADIYSYNATSNSWSNPALRSGLPPWREFSYGTAFDDGTQQLAFLGLGRAGSSVLNDWYMFDGEAFYQRSPMPVARYHPAMLAVETADRGWSIFVGAGGGTEGNLRDFYEYNVIDDSWTRRQDLPGPARHHPFYWDAKIGEKHYAYIGMGHGYGTPLNPRGILKDVYRYDPDEMVWERMADFPGEARVAGTQFTLHNDPVTGRDRPFVLSGDGDDHSTMETGELWEYLPEEDSWVQLPPHPGFSRWAPGSFVIGCDVFFTCGYDRATGILEKDLMKDRLC